MNNGYNIWQQLVNKLYFLQTNGFVSVMSKTTGIIKQIISFSFSLIVFFFFEHIDQNALHLSVEC